MTSATFDLNFEFGAALCSEEKLQAPNELFQKSGRSNLSSFSGCIYIGTADFNMSSLMSNRINCSFSQGQRLNWPSKQCTEIFFKCSQGNIITLMHGTGNKIDLSHGKGNMLQVLYGKDNIIDCSSGQGNLIHLNCGRGNVINMLHGQSNTVNMTLVRGSVVHLRYGEGNIINFISGEENTISLSSGRGIRINVNKLPGVRLTRFKDGSDETVQFGTNCIVQTASDIAKFDGLYVNGVRTPLDTLPVSFATPRVLEASFGGRDNVRTPMDMLPASSATPRETPTSFSDDDDETDVEDTDDDNETDPDYTDVDDDDNETEDDNGTDGDDAHEQIAGSTTDISRFPTRIFFSSAASTSDDGCAICLEDYKDGDVLKNIPCFHEFHKDCIDKWLRGKMICPKCLTVVSVTY